MIYVFQILSFIIISAFQKDHQTNNILIIIQFVKDIIFFIIYIIFKKNIQIYHWLHLIDWIATINAIPLVFKVIPNYNADIIFVSCFFMLSYNVCCHSNSLIIICNIIYTILNLSIISLLLNPMLYISI